MSQYEQNSQLFLVSSILLYWKRRKSFRFLGGTAKRRKKAISFLKLSNTTILQFYTPNPSHTEKSRWQSKTANVKCSDGAGVVEIGEGNKCQFEFSKIEESKNVESFSLLLTVIFFLPSSIVWSKLSGLHFVFSPLDDILALKTNFFGARIKQILFITSSNKRGSKIEPLFIFLSAFTFIHRQSDPIRHNLLSIKA